MIDLADKSAIVTGAGSGFGQGIATAFAAAGAKVAVLDVNEAAARSVADSLGEQALPLTADVTDTGDLIRSFDRAIQTFGNVDILVNNAGVALAPQELEEVSEADFDRIAAVNMRSIYLTSRIVVPHMKNQGGGVILNMASTAGVSPRPGLTWYNASKGWVITATKSMAVELAPERIRVNALNPVAGETPMLATFMGGDTPAARERFLASIPLGRFSTPTDLGAAAVYLCSDAASMVTGVALEVDGGRCI